ncbi:MAG: hypothetical protein DWQ34_27915 [Planctomycetota bacterium]|nr:MAG: hypothetical protein DWQ29_22825 [Planctomycetota bacterium]REJ86017.1 MAG: hypothetical protein DWQ34_27915 [Planctomycetota bacterium]REK21387.1 MAG: hypothetical protein DWQ41_21375 [Planctomycetota bacterium]REK40102.1 MAG: hypothetical protein DWQ45_00670 [Planctomycetota bacterium]
MKKCRRCTKPATLHITEIRNGVAQPLHLCEKCAKKYLSSVEAGGNVEDPVGEGGNELVAALAGEDSADADALTCPQCGITFKQFRSQGRLGCPHDYVVFRDELIPLLESIHSETQHVGKIPQRTPAISRKQHDLIRLRSDLKSAVQNEKYEEAADLRDRIRRLEEELVEEQSN